MSYLDAIILGLTQGITEFIPVSSSGHLVIMSHLLGLDSAFTFDVLLNIGTLTALIIYYRVRIWSLIVRVFKGKDTKLFLQLIVATIPAVIFGYTLNSQIEKLNEMIWVVIVMLVVVGVLMIFMGNAKPGADDEEIEKSVSWPTSIKIGLAQAIALIPGTSRSGITILVGLRSGLSAKRAAEFSFLLAIPVMIGGIANTIIGDGGISFITDNMGVIIVGNIVSFVSGIIAIGFLLKLLSNSGLRDFGYYRIGLAAVLIVLLALGKI